MKLYCLLLTSLMFSLNIFIEPTNAIQPKTMINIVVAENNTISSIYNMTNISYKHNEDIKYQIINIFIV
jgi:hypothetical protein